MSHLEIMEADGVLLPLDAKTFGFNGGNSLTDVAAITLMKAQNNDWV